MSELRWHIIHAEPRHEPRVYAAVLEFATDAWLPQEPRFSRAGARHQRQWWAPVLPGYFFAQLPASDLRRLSGIRCFVGIARDCDGKEISIPADVVMAFRDELNHENTRIMRLGGFKPRERDKADHRKRIPSRRLKPKVAQKIRIDIGARLNQGHCAAQRLVA